MTPDQWKHLESVLAAARKQPAEERSRFVANVCAGDPEMQHEVELMLRQAESADAILLHTAAPNAFFDAPAAPATFDGISVAPLRAGTRLGAYEIRGQLGAGGMGTVYKARDIRLGRPVAIKLLSNVLQRDSRAQHYFEREAKAISSLNHPHICTLYDVGNFKGMDYLVMEFLDGETLREQLDRGPLQTDQAIRYAAQIGEALAEAHRRGFLHGDLKPSNVMGTANGAKLLDFGLASRLHADLQEDGSSSSTRSGSQPNTRGTLAYMAPEQFEAGVSDARSEIFSYGAVLYEMVSGRRPFSAVTNAGLVATILRCEPPQLEIRGFGAKTLVRIIRKCLARRPDARWRRFEEVLDVLFLSHDRPKRRLNSSARSLETGARALRRLVVLPFRNLSPKTLEGYVPVVLRKK